MSSWSKTMRAIGDAYAARLKRAFINRARKTDSATSWSEVEKAIPLGPMMVYNTIQWGKWAPGELLAKAYNAVYNKSSTSLHKEASDQSDVGLYVSEESFKMPNPEAEAWLYQYSAAEIVEITLQERKAISFILGEGQRTGQTYKQTATMLRNTLSLTDKQAQAVNNYYRKLRADGMTEAQAQQLAAKYHSKLLKYRSETIALTESFTATNTAWSNSIRESVRDGTLSQQEYELYWLTAPDERRCEICGGLAGVTGDLNAQQFDGYGKPPIHPRCRCQMIVQRKK